MATLTVHNVPARLHERLKARAAAHRRSVDDEALTVLDEALSQEAPSSGPADVVARLDAIRARSTYQAAPGEIEAIIRDLRDTR